MSTTSRPPRSDLPPGIDDYLESVDDYASVSIEGLDDIIAAIVLKSNVNEEAIKIIIKRFFQEVRNAVLRNKVVVIKKFGIFSVQSPARGTKKKIFIKFKPSKHLIKRINGRLF